MRCCQYFPIAISGGENTKIFVDADFKAENQIAIQKLTEDHKNTVEAQIKKLEQKLAQTNSVLKDMY